MLQEMAGAITSSPRWSGRFFLYVALTVSLKLTAALFLVAEDQTMKVALFDNKLLEEFVKSLLNPASFIFVKKLMTCRASETLAKPSFAVEDK